MGDDCICQRMGTSAAGASLKLAGSFSLEQIVVIINQGIRDKITSAANRSACPLNHLLPLAALMLDIYIRQYLFLGLKEKDQDHLILPDSKRKIIASFHS